MFMSFALSDRSPFTDHMRARVYHMQLAAACDRAAIEALPALRGPVPSLARVPDHLTQLAGKREAKEPGGAAAPLPCVILGGHKMLINKGEAARLAEQRMCNRAQQDALEGAHDNAPKRRLALFAAAARGDE